MEPLTIHLKSNTLYMRITYGILVCGGLFIIGRHLYDYFQYQMVEIWLDVFIGMCLFLAGLLGFTGNSFGSKYKVTIDEEGITPENGWSNPVNWDQLKSVWLDKNYIRYEYKSSGARDKIRLPVYTQGQHELVDEKLAEAAEKFDLEFKSGKKINLSNPPPH